MVNTRIRFNPFRPGSIVSPGMFSGRYEELVTLERILLQTQHGNAEHFLIQGERGIGKSSLLYCIDCVASGQILSLRELRYGFLTVNIALEPSTEYADIVKKVGTELNRAVAVSQPIREKVQTAWDFLKRWEVMGVKYKEEIRQLGASELISELTSSVSRVVENSLGAIDGVLILIDEADKPPAKSNLGEFVKLFSEQLSKRGSGQVALGLAGLSTVVRKLRKSHESSVRILECLTLEPLSQQERLSVIQRGLQEAKEENKQEVTIDEDAANLIAGMSEGYPHFIQQFAYSAFEADEDDRITMDDVTRGAFREHGALQQLGVRYFEDQYFEKIGSDEYREVLQAMAENNMGDWTTKQQLRAATSLKETTLTNAISALSKRNIIIPSTERKGIYRLPTRSFAVWIKAFARRPAGGL